MYARIYRLFTGNYNILLTLLLLLFIFRPYNQGIIYTGVWKVFFIIALLEANFTCNHSRKVTWIIAILAIPIIALTWTYLLYESPAAFAWMALLTAIFLSICTVSIIYDVLTRTEVNLETLRGVISAYFLAAFVFGYIYLCIEYFDPGTMLIQSKKAPPFPEVGYFSDMLYYSFTTLLTIGYGDIVPVKQWGETTSILEGIIGQFYIAILVARIVTIYSFLENKRLLQSIEKDKPSGY